MQATLDDINNQLSELKDQLKQISVFNESDLKIIDTRKQSINKKVFINDKKTDEYIKLKENKKVKNIDKLEFALDIIFNNFSIVYEKIDALQFLSTDLYQRIDLLGKSVTKLIDSHQINTNDH